MSDALKPCPFCGSVPQKRDVGDYFVTCPGCGIDGPAGDSDGLPHAADAWNTRADSKLAAAEARAERTGHFRNGKPRNEVCYCGNQMKDVQTCQTCGYTLNPQFMEVPMPLNVGFYTIVGEKPQLNHDCTGWRRMYRIVSAENGQTLGYMSDPSMLTTYGDAREAAGYAAGVAAGGKDVERYQEVEKRFSAMKTSTSEIFLDCLGMDASEVWKDFGELLDAALRGKLQGDDQMNRIERRSHQPKGSMCTSCAKWREDCSGLPFETMPVIVEAPSGVKIVRCTEHAKSSKENKR